MEQVDQVERAQALSQAHSGATAQGNETRQRLKRAAQRLFALHGVELVSVRDIVAEAGQRNIGSLNYYFGSKEGLIHELAIDAVKGIDAARNRRLDEAEAQGGPHSVREVMHILADLALDLGAEDEDDETWMRFITMLLVNQRDLFLNAVPRSFDSGYWRAAEHICRLLPGIPEPIMRQRLELMPLYMAAALSTREAARGRSNAWASFWRHSATYENLIDTAVGLLSQDPSPETLALLAAEDSGG
ncbi:TetR/AcrR family transcriptional regulator [Zavarzinia sp. CC-PAN008]|uniref:TetR/AcrR family transcriptional regulator n=1 Tax=Zavarzinia sp. CC-PAN008 TaxID=3243332 RepID=UPI003F744A04